MYAAGRPLEDAESRTIFVNNVIAPLLVQGLTYCLGSVHCQFRLYFVMNAQVHFAATKDSLSRHFNKFGEVLKVVILTDAATGQPKG